MLLNICQTYGELGEADPDGARDAYYPAAWDCVLAASQTLATVQNPHPELVLGIMTKKAQTAADLHRPAAELSDLQEQLDRLLGDPNLLALKPAVWSAGFRQSARLARLRGQKARCYRRLLTGMARLRMRIASMPLALDTAVSDLRRTNSDLVAALVEWNDLQRAIFFAGTSPSQRARVWPRGGRWRPAPAHTVVLFQLLSKTRLSAFVISEQGIALRDIPLLPVDLIRLSARFLTAKSESEKTSATPASDPAWLTSIDQIAVQVAQGIFDPLEDLLPPGGPLGLIPESALMRILPLHLAELKTGQRLLDRFELSYGSHLSFEDPEKRTAGGLFLATYAPQFARLPFAALEARAVAEKYPAALMQQESGAGATPEAVLAGLKQARTAHLCSHGSFDWETPLDSKLFYAGRGLTVREMQLSLALSPCDLIVLSACEAGARSSSAGECSDFASVLLRAGVHTIIAADWRIDDISTTILMHLLHEALAGGAEPAAALAIAQRKIRTSTGAATAQLARRWLDASDPDLAYVTEKLDALEARGDAAVFSHPVYWGSFSVNTAAFPLRRSV